ncbi:MAG: RDD family protein [Rhodococcus sp.]|nr:RDD family protein [Rhodococcus sp. (in: high G+C Gram-positive bacteria)]
MTDEILTGEGVLLDVRPASFASRILSAALDAFVILTLASFWLYLILMSLQLVSEAMIGAFTIASIATVTIIIPAVVETLTRGYSLGKLAVGLRVVRDDGGPVRFRQAFVRALVGFGELWMTLGGIAVLTSISHPKGKRVGDILAGTYVIRTRTANIAPAPIQMPPYLATWARTADIRRLPDGLALTARQFLNRAATMNPISRAELGLQLAQHLNSYVAPPPPIPIHPEDFIAAVLVERRSREFALAQSRAATAAARSDRMRQLPHMITSGSPALD